MSQKSFKFSEATCQNLHFCRTLPALGSAAARTYCHLTALAWARIRLSAWHRRLCAGSCNAAVRFGSLSSWVCSWQVLAKRQWKAMQLSAEHVSQQKFWSSGCARGGAGGPRLCCTRLCVSATFAHGNLVLRAAPQTQEVARASGPPPEHQTADCVPAV